MAKKKDKTPKARNWMAAHAKGLTGRKGAGAHRNRKHLANKYKCRGRIRV
jgi:hypothetical protein